jgi:SAM-dependent MidA family methyltransferase
MSQIEDLLRQEIGAGGPISFARFMEVALYCPEIGYYERDPGIIGFRGDFYTSASIGPLFGQLLAAQLASWSERLGLGSLTWIEAGAHDGSLALAVLEWLGKNRPAVLDRLRFLIIEPSDRRRIWQEQRLHQFSGRIDWTPSIGDLKGDQLNGIIFSNELLDAFPVHRLVWDGRQWFERGVSVAEDRLAWIRLDHSGFDTDLELKRAGFVLGPGLLAVLPVGFTIDISPGAGDWWQEAAEVLGSGKLLTFDYGLMTEELLVPERVDGTVRAYYQQRVSDDPLDRPGEQDITAHVNFSQLERAGENAGLKTEMLVSQESFLSTVVKDRLVDEGAQQWRPEEVRQFQTLTHPEHMGRSFRVLVQSR